MSIFIGKPDQPDTPPQPETVVVNDGFFPDIDPADVRSVARVPDSITADRLRAAILAAIMSAEIDLRTFAAAQIASGYATLDAVPASKLDGKSVQLIRYHRVIACYAKAELIDRHRDFDTTSAGFDKADELTPTMGELRRDAMHAIRDMLGKTRTTVDLI